MVAGQNCEAEISMMARKMMMVKAAGAALCLTFSTMSHAETPASLTASYSAEAVQAARGFAPSAERGREFFGKDWGVSQKMPGCSSCHGKDLHADGKHAITGKRIAPLSPLANPERFTAAAKVEKWFKRNCAEVVGRECTPAEKADFIQFVSQ